MRLSTRTVALIAGCGCLLFAIAGALLLFLLSSSPALFSSGRSSSALGYVSPVPAIAVDYATPQQVSESVTTPARQAPLNVWTANTVAPPPTNTSEPTSTPGPTDTPPPTATDTPGPVDPAPAVDQATSVWYVVAPVQANARSCPRTTCGTVTSFARGAEVNVIKKVSGESLGGASTWYSVSHGGLVAYVHAPLLSRSRPAPTDAPQQQEDAAQGQADGPAADSGPVYPGMSCEAIREQHGDGNFDRNHPAYNEGRDSDGDGIACETGP